MATLQLAGVRKQYPNGFVAVQGIDLDVDDGAFVVLVGPSGCGKSTLLRMIAGLERITAGDVHIGERRVNDLEPADRDIAMVFQNYALYPHMSVYANMAYGLRNRGTPKQEIESRVRSAADTLGIADLLDRKPRQLSGGQRQRVAMGRAIVRKPQVFLFDEPLSNLDAKLRVQMRVEVRRLTRALGVTSVYVTHDQVEAMTMADVLVVLNAGVAEQIGTPLDLYHAPASEFVATFIGSPSMNLLPAARVDGNRLRIGDWSLEREASGEVTCGIRPEHIELDAEGPLRVTIDVAEPLGAETLLHGRLPSEDSLVIRVPGSKLHVRPGDEIRCRVDEQHLHLFARETGRRM